MEKIPKSIQISNTCQLCSKRPWYGSVAGHRICSHCGDLLKAIAKAARVHFDWESVRDEDKVGDIAVVAGNSDAFRNLVKKLELPLQYTHHIGGGGQIKGTIFGRVIFTCGYMKVSEERVDQVKAAAKKGFKIEHISCCSDGEPD